MRAERMVFAGRGRRRGGTEGGIEGIDVATPGAAGAVEPGFELVESGGVEGLDARSTGGTGDDKPGGAEELEVLGNGRGAESEGGDELAGGAIADGEELDNAAPGGIGDGGEALHGEHN